MRTIYTGNSDEEELFISAFPVAVLNDQSIALGLKNKIEIRDSTNGKLLRTLNGHTGWVEYIVVMDNGLLVSGSSQDKKIIVWDPQTGEVIRGKATSDEVNCLAALKNNRLASGSHKGQFSFITIWNIDTGEELLTLRGHNSQVKSLLQLGDDRLVAGFADNVIKVININTGDEICTLKSYDRTKTTVIHTLIALPNNQLASGLSNGLILIWNIKSGHLVHILKGHVNVVWSMCLLKNQTTLISASKDNKTILWNIVSGKKIKSLEETAKPVRSFALLRDGRLVRLFVKTN